MAGSAAAEASARASAAVRAFLAWRGAPAGDGTEAHSDGFVHSFHNELGISLSTYALVLGLCSGLSLPLGAALGIRLSPVDDRICAAMMAFGAGALLFAVTVELYGHALRELEMGAMGMVQLITTISFALLGALFYLDMNRKLEKMFDQEPAEDEEEDDEEELVVEEQQQNEEGLARNHSTLTSGTSSSSPGSPTLVPQRQSSLPLDYGEVRSLTGSPRPSDDQPLCAPRRQSSLPPDYGSVPFASVLPPEAREPSPRRNSWKKNQSTSQGALLSFRSLDRLKAALLQGPPRSGRAKSLLKLLPSETQKQAVAKPWPDRQTSPRLDRQLSPRLPDVAEAAHEEASAPATPPRCSSPDSGDESGEDTRKRTCCGARTGAGEQALDEAMQKEEEKRVEDQLIQKARATASALFLGLLIDGIPEGILMGFLAAEGHLTPVLVISLFVANFPEAFSSASLLVLGKMPVYIIVGMWTLLCILVGVLTGLSCKLLLAGYPDYATNPELPLSVLLFVAMIEGLTGGAMMACISSVMLPEAFERAGEDGNLLMSSGFLCTCGFLLAVYLKASLG
mmetsp:Transcript_48443/g.122254  ORF Transcript_48443/g.122254 Transcript_48443/m.122254 type:complete len:566 (+) Transcript_48443:138-1835(+)